MNPNQQNSLNMIPPSFAQSQIPNFETLYTNAAAAAQVAAPQIGNFNFVHHASPATNPYFLANILSQQPSIMNHHSAMLAGGSDHHLNQQISSSMVNHHHQVQMYDNFIYHHQQQQQHQQQQHNHMLAASSAATSLKNYNAEAKKFAAAAQYSQILPPFFAAAANSTTNMMLANALLANSYGDVSRNSLIAQSSSIGNDNLNISEHSMADTMTPNRMVNSVPNSNNEAVYLPSPASNKSSLSACDAKSLDRSPFAHPCGPGSHQDLNVHSPSTISVQRTSSNLSFQSPAAAITDRSPAATAVISPSLANLGLVPQSPACAIDPKMSLFHTNTPSSSGCGQAALFQQYVVAASPKSSQLISNMAADFQTSTPKANNLILASASLSNEQQKSHFYVKDRNHNSTTVNNNSKIPAVTQEDPFSVLTKDVNLDLDALAGPSNVTQQFWDDLGDSVLDDALLSSSASQEESGVVGQSLLHSVFEFPSLQSVAPFDDIVTSMENSIRNFDLIDEHSSHILDAESCGSQASADAVVQQQPYRHSWSKNDEDLAITRKNKPNNNAKENELAEIDREFARHFNAIVQKDTIQIATPREIKLLEKMDTFTADLDFCTSKKLPVALSFKASSSGEMAFSPIRFDNGEKDDQFEVDDTLMNRFPHLGKYFGPLSPKIRTSTNVFGDEILQQQAASESETQASASTPLTKWAPRKSKRVPIYKQQTQKARPQNAEMNLHATAQAIAVPTTARVMSCDTKRLSLKVSLRSAPQSSSSIKASKTSSSGQQHDSPYSFTEEDDEPDVSVEQPSTSLAAEIKQETPDKQALSGCLVRERRTGMMTRRQKSSTLAAAGSAHPGGNAKPSVDEKLVEEEVKRKLMQISSLHPELRLAISNCGNKSDVGGGVRPQETSFHYNFSDEDAMRQAFTQPLTVVDSLRHVVPKKRLSSRQNSLTPPPPSQGTLVTPVFLPPRNSSAGVAESSSDFRPQVSFPQPFVCTRVISDTETAKPVNLAPSKAAIAAFSLPEIKPLKLTIVKSEPLPSAPTPEPLKPKLILRIPKRCLSTENDILESQTTVVKKYDDGDDDFTKVRKHKHRKKKKRGKERCEIVDNLDVQGAVNDRVLMSAGGPSTSSQGGNSAEAELGQDYNNATTSKRTINDNFSDINHQNVVLNKNRKKMRWLQASEDRAFSNGSQLVAQSCIEPNRDSYDSEVSEKAPDNSNNNGNKVLDHTPIFVKGAFVVYKSDLSKPDCPIWRVDSQNLLQKFLPADKDGRTIYVGSSTNQELFAAIQVKNLHQTKQEMTVQLENPITDLFPAISFEIADGVDRSIPSYSITENNSSISFELEHPQKEALQTYVHILIVHSIIGNYMQVLKLRNETTLLTKMSEVDNLNNEKKRKLTKDACWSPKFEDALEWYPYCTVNEDDGSGLHCQACGKNVVENVLQLFANEAYDFDTLLSRQPKTTVSGSPIPSQDFHVCPSCADIAVLYHKLTHMRYHLYKQCLDKVDLIRGDNTDMEPALIIENCLMQNSWIVGVSLYVLSFLRFNPGPKPGLFFTRKS